MSSKKSNAHPREARQHALADRKDCGDKSAALREILYKEAGVPHGSFRIKEQINGDSIAKAEKRAVKYGRRKSPKKK